MQNDLIIGALPQPQPKYPIRSKGLFFHPKLVPNASSVVVEPAGFQSNPELRRLSPATLVRPRSRFHMTTI